MSTVMDKIKRNLRRAEVDRMYSTVIDSLGNQHVVAYQRRLMSCGIACCAMVVQRVRGIRLEESALRSYSRCFYQGPGTNSAAYNTFSGTEFFNLAIMLKKMCVPATAESGGFTHKHVKRASMGTPAIALINWDTSKGQGKGGGHFVVVDSFDPSTNVAMICDPWYGLVECDMSAGGYSVKKDKGSFSDNWIHTDG